MFWVRAALSDIVINPLNLRCRPVRLQLLLCFDPLMDFKDPPNDFSRSCWVLFVQGFLVQQAFVNSAALESQSKAILK